jgi:hypothetical protein
MKMMNIALLVGLSIAGLASPAMSAVRNSSGAAVTGRDGSIAACNAEARNRYRGNYTSGWDQDRAFVYGDCMHDRGFAQ